MCAAATSSTPRFGMARRPPASSSRSRTRCSVAALLEHARRRLYRGRLSGRQRSPTTRSSAESRTRDAVFTAFGMTKRAGRSAGNDPGVQAVAGRPARRRLLRRASPGIGRSRWRSECSLEQNLRNLAESHRQPASGREACWSIASTSSMATRRIRPMR